MTHGSDDAALASVERLVSVVKAAWRAGATADIEASPYLASALEAVARAPERRLPAPALRPPCAHIDARPKPGGDRHAAELEAALRGARDLLSWGEAYPELAGDRRYHDFRANYAYAEIMGPGGPVVSDRVSAFVTIQGPGVLYPAHTHPALEVYYVIGGRAEWRRGDEPWARREPGSFILHRSEVPHATRTATEPVLALAVWLDHLHGASVMVQDAALRR